MYRLLPSQREIMVIVMVMMIYIREIVQWLTEYI